MNERELLEHYRPWLRKVAAGMTTPSMVEDLAQEGWIALWLAYGKADERRAPTDWWLKKKAHGRMITLVSRDWRTLKSRTWGIPAGQARPSTDEELSTVGASVWDSEQLLDGADLIDGAEWAYHHGEIARALDELTPAQRKYVVLRFWHGYGTWDMVDEYGYDPRGIWAGARKALISSLAHLAGVTLEHTPGAG